MLYGWALGGLVLSGTPKLMMALARESRDFLRNQNFKANQKPNLGFSHEIVWTILGFQISKV